MKAIFVSLALLLLPLICLLSPLAVTAQPVIVEPGWTLIRTIETTGPMAANFNPRDGQIYFGKRSSGSDGLYRIDNFGFSEKLASGSNVAAVAVQPDSGHIFFSEDYGGGIYRTEFGGTGRATWVSGFRSGDDDPVGMAFAPFDYAGGVLQPGEALSVDRGNGGYDDVWWWTPLAAQGEYLVHPNDGTMADPVDVAISQSTVYVVDSGLTATGAIYILEADSSLTLLSTSEPIDSPAGITIDPATGDLLVLDQAAGRLVRVEPGTGLVSEVVTGLTTASVKWAGVDAAPDGRLLIVTDYDADRIYVLARCDATGQPEVDCNGNNVYDLCEVAQGSVLDCNHNGVPDDCDLASGASDDCNLDGIPDDCPVCPPVEVVFIMDTSTSMDDEAAVLCNNMGLIVDYLETAGVDVYPTLFGICDTPGGAYSCLDAAITDSLGTTVPGSPPPGLETLGACPGGNQVCQEDWGLATAVVAGLCPWLPDSTSIRLIIPLSDEGPWCGDPVTQNDNDAITHAIAIAVENEVIVSPITGTGSSGSVIALAQALANSTGGTHFSSSESANDIAYAIVSLVLDACAAITDCDGNGVLDECDIAAGTVMDFNGNGIPDVCESGAVGVPGLDPVLLAPTLHQNYPNPFNPLTQIVFELPRDMNVDLAVFTLAGQRIATLVKKRLSAGSHLAVWNGRDEVGRRVASGAYVYRLQVDGFSQSRRLILLK